MRTTAYGWLMLAGIFVSLWFWTRLAKRDDRLVVIYVAALVSAFLGAKLMYLFAEGWLHWHDPDRWVQLATGKSIVGGLMGGFVGVEIAKRLLHYRSATGDWFALVVPVGIVFGRVGCLLHGCCLGVACEPSWFTINDAQGVARWPAALLELIFNAIMFIVALFLRRRNVLPGQHFHIYLMAYGVFRFLHEYLRATPAVFGPFSGYQIGALGVFFLGLAGFVKRRGDKLQSQPAAA